ncbi:MAG TPA: PEP-CTERM sorting domain-containing protein [Verrucomicrobiales bacterium]|jgi:MYXO-CTERM domain-containing protein|nr:PEP-CTERM sorting domain-containing protein [Verrucomicrobiales bacterium]
MNLTPLTASGHLRVALALLLSATFARSAVSFADIRLWAGAAPGPGVNEAAIVIDFHDGSPGVTWGFRWNAAETRTGQDMLAAVLGADSRLTVDSAFFPNSFSFGNRTRSYSDNGTPANYFDDVYWGYWVNNDVYYDPNDFNLNSHIVPPATQVVPLGNPYGPGHWVESSTGAAARPLVNGSWDGWTYGAFGTQPGDAVAAVPEPAAASLLVFAGAFVLRRRRSSNASAA